MEDTTLEQINVDELINNMQQQLREQLGERLNSAKIVGIHTGGTWIAEQIHRQLDNPHPLGELNISFYRDDFTQIGLHPQVAPSNLPYEVDGETIILIDDVLFTGRTIRAALNEIFDYGRPARVILAVLVDRKAHELPIQADITGTSFQLQPHEQIKLDGPKPLQLFIEERDIRKPN
ncbi:MAG: bifunctional pyr operon transcriptional regulator/uracil phosphoribosyltransferase PyrR [Gammaproteobacteria bacterium]|jgi:pyrimidine operon attenuation protein/uracil phosphoribosyltransferase|nr:bifunctional pyr operon transcriptional regulator/uracil phosphoribosyltransferase PyrR [Gammaproteobacteria bacterium]MBT3488228.1 bifunctional pyr operon transcriptional regulator/uracil phosphoribosyltransferase PyrR [Gammaproteobacteria bacterium]MBT3719005.1 bifunctional pyr operon transcriptional regulator/uracil phosphoribosyltransferase PyrR [Gammaproteobacteria bacterium]MBT3843859.1 bifunctional pyr operon transcriptional regulator/uracil phosphoribosyltransferase PyrR [Gammaproteob